MTFFVRIGGEAKDHGELFNTREEAEQYAVWRAKRLAHAKGDDVESVEIYNESARGGQWGACPAGDDGGYYPIIEEV